LKTAIYREGHATMINQRKGIMKLGRWIAPMAALFLCGCFQAEDELTVQPDGSGTVKLTLHSSLPDEMTQMMGMSSHWGGGTASYPPTSQAAAQRFFPQKDFTVKCEEKSGDDGKTLRIDAAFKDINALLASPYGRAHQLSLATNAQGELRLLALSGGSVLAQGSSLTDDGDGMGLEIPGLEDARKKKNEMRFVFRVNLPNPVTTANQVKDNRTVTWTVERAKCKDDDEFGERLGGTLEAACSAAGITFAPVTPARLGLVSFDKLTGGKIAATAKLPDTNKIASAARFVPCQLHVTRILELSGESYSPGSEASLTGAVELPPELRPDRWGEPVLEEVTDAKGADLLPKGDDASRAPRHSFSSDVDVSDDDDEESPDAAAPPKAAPEKPHIITLEFKAPDWKVKQIARIKATLTLAYLGGIEVIKLSNAVPASLVMDMSKRHSFSGGMDSNRRQLTDSRLSDLGASLSVDMAMAQGPVTMISLQTGGAASLLDAQVFDAAGRPWPTTVVQSAALTGDARSCQLMVAGKPKPPFSLAVALGGVGASVTLPILTENVPVGGN
jgi:hypothetical protein